MSVWNVRAYYDTEAHVWYAVDGDIPGLAVDAATLEELEVKIGTMLEDLLKIHAEDFADKSLLVPPHKLKMIAFHERSYDVAA